MKVLHEAGIAGHNSGRHTDRPALSCRAFRPRPLPCDANRVQRQGRTERKFFLSVRPFAFFSFAASPLFAYSQPHRPQYP